MHWKPRITNTVKPTSYRSIYHLVLILLLKVRDVIKLSGTRRAAVVPNQDSTYQRTYSTITGQLN